MSMATPPRSTKPHAVLFACGLNSVRSPMAAGLFKRLVGPNTYVASAGVRKDELDPFAVAALEEIGVDIAKHRPMTFEDLDEWEGLNFDLIVTLAPEAHHKALELTRTMATDVEYWPTVGSDRGRGQPRTAARRLPGGARPIERPDQGAVRLEAGRK